nr:hypothetical protein TR92_01165 [Brucella anthropi]
MSVQKPDDIDRIERLALKISAILVLLLVAILLIIFMLSYEIQSSVYDFLYPSENVIARMNSDPFLSVLGTTSMIIVGIVIFLNAIIFLHLFSKRLISIIIIRARDWSK